MDAQNRGIITLLRSGLTGEKLALPEGFDLEQAMEALHKHQIQAVCYFGVFSFLERNCLRECLGFEISS